MTVRFKGTGAAARAAEAVANQMPRHPGQGSRACIPGRARRAPERWSRWSPEDHRLRRWAATRCRCVRRLVEFRRAPSSAATTSASSSIRRRACLRASRSEDDLDVRHRDTPVAAGGSFHHNRPAQLTAHPWPQCLAGPIFLPGDTYWRTAARTCRLLAIACAPSWRHASGYVPLTSVRSWRHAQAATILLGICHLGCGSDRVDHTSSHRHPCANGHRFSMAMPPSCSNQLYASWFH